MNTTNTLKKLINDEPAEVLKVVNPDQYLNNQLHNASLTWDGLFLKPMNLDTQNQILGLLEDIRDFNSLRQASRNAYIGFRRSYEENFNSIEYHIKPNEIVHPDLLYRLKSLTANTLKLKLKNKSRNFQLNLKNLEEFCNIISANKNIKIIHLDISNNHIGYEGASIIAKYLFNLTELNIANNDIGSIGVNEIVAKLTKLNTLDISSNAIHASDISKDLENLNMLVNLKISSNALGRNGILDILSKLANLEGLTTLDVSHNWLMKEHVLEIARRLPTLSKLNISGNPSSFAVNDEISKKLPNLCLIYQ
ncbi:MAG: hypothetical protein ACK5XF_09665 [Neisseriaceae bacterium]